MKKIKVNFYIAVDDLEKIKLLAENKRTSTSGLIRQYIVEGIANEKKSTNSK